MKLSSLLSGQRSIPVLVFVGLVCCTSPALAQDAIDRDRPSIPGLTVTGRGEAFAAPDTAQVQMGAVIEDKDATEAQNQVNEIMQRAIKALQGLKLPQNKIKTAGLSLSPVYEQQERPRGVTRPRIIGYRARNSLRVELDDLTQVGKVIDTAVTAGANQVENLSLELRDDMPVRRQALRRAVDEAQAKAETIAEAMGIRLKNVRQVTEGGIHIMQPRMELAQARMATLDHSTPVEPGEVRVEATVTVHYSITDATTERR